MLWNYFCNTILSLAIINALLKNKEFHDLIMKYNTFTDIEFISSTSTNTHAFALAMFVALSRKGVNMSDFKNPNVFFKRQKIFI